MEARRNEWRGANGRCKQFFNHPQPRPSTSTSTTNNAESSKPKSRGRGIGSDKNPLDMAYYDVLGLESQCTQDEIKKAYRRLAIKVSRPLGRERCSAARLIGLLGWSHLVPCWADDSYIPTKIVMIQMQKKRYVSMNSYYVLQSPPNIFPNTSSGSWNPPAGSAEPPPFFWPNSLYLWRSSGSDRTW